MNRLFVLILFGVLASCSKPYDYDSGSAYTAHETIKVKVISKRSVTVSKSDGILGKGAGAAIGGIVGASTTNSEAERAVLTIGGAIIGSVIGDAMQKRNSRVDATEYVLEKIDGDLIALVIKDESLKVGDKAYLIMGERPALKRID